MQLPNDSNDLLIEAPSFILIPVFPVLEARSDPAKSINESLPPLTSSLVLFALLFLYVIVKTACERDEVSLN